MQMNENSILAVTNPVYLLTGALLICALAYVCARRYRNTNDFKKSIHLYLPAVFVLNIILIAVLGIGVFLTVVLDIFGIIVLALISNYFFYH